MADDFQIDKQTIINRGWAFLPAWLKAIIIVLSLLFVGSFFLFNWIGKAKSAWDIVKPKQQKSENIDMFKQQDLPQKKGLQDGGFEYELKHWDVTDHMAPRAQNVATPDTVTTTHYNTRYSFSQNGRTGNNCLYIKNWQPQSSEKYIAFDNKIYGLKPNTKYSVTFYIRKTGEFRSNRSLLFVVGMPWHLEGRYFEINPQEVSEDWKKLTGILTTGDYTEANLWLISDDVCYAYVDDITLKEID